LEKKKPNKHQKYAIAEEAAKNKDNTIKNAQLAFQMKNKTKQQV
jgi:hypothetical protein